MKKLLCLMLICLYCTTGKAQLPGMYINNTSSLSLRAIFNSGETSSGVPCTKVCPSATYTLVSSFSYYNATTAGFFSCPGVTPDVFNEIKVLRYVGSTPVGSVYLPLCVAPGTYPVSFPGVPTIFADISIIGTDYYVTFRP